MASRFRQDRSSDRIPAAAALLAFAALLVAFNVEGTSSDLLALWTAGQFLLSGAIDQVYPTHIDVFSMEVPETWVTFLSEAGHSGRIYPFVYPPIWAALIGLIPDYSSFMDFAFAARVANALFLSASIWIAYRVVEPSLSQLAFCALVCALLLNSPIGYVAMVENQPQILVNFLILLAIERTKAGAQGVAGVALGLAAAIKIYPVMLALLFFVSGARRTGAVSLAVAVAVAGLSILVCGWPIHSAFLTQIGAIADTSLVTGNSYNLNSLLAQLLHRDDLSLQWPTVINDAEDVDGEWYYMTQSARAAVVSRVLPLATLAGLAAAMRHAAPARLYGWLWPLALTAVSLVLPIGWTYYFIPTLIFVPKLLDAFGPKAGTVAVFAVVAPVVVLTGHLLVSVSPLLEPLQANATLAMLLAAVLFAVGARREAKR